MPMLSRVRIAIRFFFMGLAVGVLLAPRSGRETRRMVRERADRLLNDLLDAATLSALDAAPTPIDGAELENGGNGNAPDRATSAAGA
jgi:hypothetical protein